MEVKDINISELAGKYYKPVDQKTGIPSGYIYNEINTFSVPSVHPSFEGYEGPKENKDYKVGIQIPGTTNVPITEKLTYRIPFHSFKYYESMGSVYGMHGIINERESFEEGDVSITERWKSEPANIDRIDRLRCTGAKSHNTSYEDICALTIMSRLNDDGSYTHSYEDMIYENDSKQRELEIFIGEFHLLTNTPKSIYRCNLAADIQYIKEGIDVFNRDKLFAPIVHNEKIRHNSNSFLEFELGLARTGSEASKPEFLLYDDLNIRHPHYIEAGAQIRWKSMKDRCTSWQKIFDGTNLSEKIENETHYPGHYVCNTKVKVNIDKLEDRLRSMQSAVPMSDFRTIIYMPSYNILPIDNIISLKSPSVSMFIDDLEDIKFAVQRNYKSGGNIHYAIEMYKGDKSNLIFRDGTSEDYEKYIDNSVDDIKYGKWMISLDGVSYSIYGNNKAMFDSTSHSNSGIDTEKYGTVKYIPDESLVKFITNNSGIYIRIMSYDGTKRE